MTSISILLNTTLRQAKNFSGRSNESSGLPINRRQAKINRDLVIHSPKWNHNRMMMTLAGRTRMRIRQEFYIASSGDRMELNAEDEQNTWSITYRIHWPYCTFPLKRDIAGLRRRRYSTGRTGAWRALRGRRITKQMFRRWRCRCLGDILRTDVWIHDVRCRRQLAQALTLI